MSAPTETTPELLKTSGSCHCGAIKYTAENIDLAKAGKCNCASLEPSPLSCPGSPLNNVIQVPYVSRREGTEWKPPSQSQTPRRVLMSITPTCRLGVALPLGSITITNTPSGTPTALRHGNATDATLFPAELAYYCPTAHRESLPRDAERIRHCFCRVCGTNLFIVGDIPGMGEYVSVNVPTLDLKSVNRDLKDLSDPKKLRYCSGLDDSWKTQAGEPFPHGAW
ncbi:hypothetical protein Dda_0563 [Drechslerella dactyloides]|uniref:CENP-V/GFA domain-containing protein n=1 Tax=Drechslerella dactyloides TaxID=74499 RepID=A0AAD6J7Z2_DREDA|nr:hypothetical protein Dda_0563 [Drechslerella dactyloides]